MQVMDDYKTTDTINKYRELYNKDSSSKIFAPLAEAYRKAGQLDQAYQIAKKGIESHPDFASGQLTYARVLIDLEKAEEAISHLKIATEMSPDNFLAHKILGETYIQLKEPNKALQVFKMALYLDPMDEFAKKMVKKLESLSAADFKEDVLNQSLSEETSRPPLPPASKPKLIESELDRYLSLIDAYISRNDHKNANHTLTEALDKIGKSPELQRRQIFLSKRFADSSQNINEIDTIANLHLKVLNKLLKQIEDRRVY